MWTTSGGPSAVPSLPTRRPQFGNHWYKESTEHFLSYMFEVNKQQGKCSSLLIMLKNMNVSVSFMSF